MAPISPPTTRNLITCLKFALIILLNNIFWIFVLLKFATFPTSNPSFIKVCCFLKCFTIICLLLKCNPNHLDFIGIKLGRHGELVSLLKASTRKMFASFFDAKHLPHVVWLLGIDNAWFFQAQNYKESPPGKS